MPQQRPPDLDASGQPATGRPPDLDAGGKPLPPPSMAGNLPRGLQPAGSFESSDTPPAADAPSAGFIDSIKNWLTAPTSKAKLAEAMHGAAHPQELADFLPLLLPGSVGMAAAKAVPAVRGPAGDAVSALGRGVEAVGASQAARRAGTYGAVGAAMHGNIPTAVTLGAAPPLLRSTGRGMQSVGRALSGEAEALAAPRALALSERVQAGSLTQAELAARAQAVREAGGLPPQQAVPTSTQPTVGQLRMAAGQGGPSGAGAIQPTPTSGTLRMSPPTEPPMGAGTPPPNWQTTVPDQVGHALDPARVDIGAEATGRAAGMTKQQVRDVATPILDAAPGQASPILPEAALKRIVDTLKGLPKGGPEREAYVAKATSGKTQWQIENIRRTLEHLGLVVPAAVGGGALVREELMKRMRAGSEQVQ